MSKIRMGIIGCGAIAQVQHMPNLGILHALYEVTWVCDISPGLARWLAEVFGVPNFTTDPHELLNARDVDAVILCHADPKTELAVAAFAAGKHVFIEKPMCYSLEEVDAICAARERAGTVGQVGYMKVYDPAYELAREEVGDAGDVRFVQVNHLHPNNNLHLKQFELTYFEDLPPEAAHERNEARQVALKQAVGDVSDDAARAFFYAVGEYDSRFVRFASDAGESDECGEYRGMARRAGDDDDFAICIGGAVCGDVDRFARFVAF